MFSAFESKLLRSEVGVIHAHSETDLTIDVDSSINPPNRTKAGEVGVILAHSKADPPSDVDSSINPLNQTRAAKLAEKLKKKSLKSSEKFETAKENSGNRP